VARFENESFQKSSAAVLAQSLMRQGLHGNLVVVASTNKCLAQSNKSRAGAKATKKRNRQ
jgi:hypothetical protein